MWSLAHVENKRPNKIKLVVMYIYPSNRAMHQRKRREIHGNDPNKDAIFPK